MLRAQCPEAGSPSLCNREETSLRRVGQKEVQSLTKRTPLRDQNRCSSNQRRMSTREIIDWYRSSRHRRLSVQELLQSSILRILRSTSQCSSHLWSVVSSYSDSISFQNWSNGWTSSDRSTLLMVISKVGSQKARGHWQTGMASAIRGTFCSVWSKDCVSILDTMSYCSVRIWRNAVPGYPVTNGDILCVEYKNDVQDGKATRYV